VSQVANATGEVLLLPDLNGVQGVAFESPTVVLAQVRWDLFALQSLFHGL
jgi:hypothetical protein